MANTYTQIYIHLIFALQNRAALIRPYFKEELQKYICGIITNKKNKLLAINVMPDHAHIFMGLHPENSLSNSAKDIKVASTTFINEHKWIPGKFAWQIGYGAFSYSHSQIRQVAKYIEDQEKHHKMKTFKEEYIGFLKNFNIDFKEPYLFEWFD